MTSSDHPTARALDAKIAARDSALDWRALEDAAHRDAGNRGLAGYRVGGASLDRGQLRAASLELAAGARCVGVVTGFCVELPNGITAETDGPPGALFLAEVLRSLGVEVILIADRHALPLLECGCDLLGFDRGLLVEFPFEDHEPDGAARSRTDASRCEISDRWINDFLSRGPGRTMSHLVAIERPGPSHTPESVAAQPRVGEAPLERFAKEVPEPDRDVCHNMHGATIGARTAKTHRLFDAARQRKPPITTIGIGDGGNEIGMGRFLWEDLAHAISGGSGGRIACRTATDFALIAGVSNWGGYALALAAGWLRGGKITQPSLEPSAQRELIERLVSQAGAVDGRTLRPEPTVDGLPLDEFLEPLAAMHAILARG